MLKTLTAQIKEFRLPSVLTPVWMVGEVICEMIIPVLMGFIVDNGIYGSDMQYIIHTGLLMILVAVCGLAFGMILLLLALLTFFYHHNRQIKQEQRKLENQEMI